MKAVFGSIFRVAGRVVLLLLSVLTLFACERGLINTDIDPYAGGREPLGVRFLNQFPVPEIARPQEEVTFAVRGLKQFENSLQFFINGTAASVLSVTDSTIIVRVPPLVSSGPSAVQIDQQLFVGPVLYIDGRVSVDYNYQMINGFSSMVNVLFPISNGFVVGGAFTNFENEAITNQVFRNGIHAIDNNGQTSSSLSFGQGTFNVSSIGRMTNGSFVVGGLFNEFNRKAVDYIATLNANGTLDTVVVDVINTDPEEEWMAYDTVARFNGGVFGGAIQRVFPVAGNRVIAVGNFTHYRRIDYSYSSRTQRAYRLVRANDIVRFNGDGSIDSTFMYNHAGFNGVVTDAIMQSDGKIVVVGFFSQYNGSPVRNIVRLNTDGTLDESYAVGDGTNAGISSVTYHAASNRVAIAGSFRTFNGQAVNGVALINSDGSVDNTFTMGDIGTGIPSYAKILSNGKVLVNGLFTTYNGVPRSNLLLLEANGIAQQEFNNFGIFSGSVYDVQETVSSLGRPALLMAGSFRQVDGFSVGNVVRLEIR